MNWGKRYIPSGLLARCSFKTKSLWKCFIQTPKFFPVLMVFNGIFFFHNSKVSLLEGKEKIGV
jgi:hypothetical protein